MENVKDPTKENDVPIQVKIPAWFGIIFGSTFLLYSVVNIILSFLDHTQGDVGENIVFLLYGLPIVIFSSGFLNKQRWGWIGYAAILAVVIILSAIGIKDIYGIILGILSLVALAWILTPSVRKLYFSS